MVSKMSYCVSSGTLVDCTHSLEYCIKGDEGRCLCVLALTNSLTVYSCH